MSRAADLERDIRAAPTPLRRPNLGTEPGDPDSDSGPHQTWRAVENYLDALGLAGNRITHIEPFGSWWRGIFENDYTLTTVCYLDELARREGLRWLIIGDQ